MFIKSELQIMYLTKLKDYIVKQTGKENTYGNTCKTLTGLILLQKK